MGHWWSMSSVSWWPDAVAGMTLASGVFCSALGCTGIPTTGEATRVPDGYTSIVKLSGGGHVACDGLRDCGAVDVTGNWTRGPGCTGHTTVRPPKLRCDGASYYVVPTGLAKSIPARFYPPVYDWGTSGRLMVQHKAGVEKAADGEFEFGYVLLDEQLEVVEEYGRTVRRAFAFRNGAFPVGLEDGRTGRVFPDGKLVVDE